MFKGKIYVYKNVNGKTEELSKEFSNEKEYNSFIKNNPSLKKMEEDKIFDIRWPKSLFDFKNFFEEAELIGKNDWIKKAEKDLEDLFSKTKKLLK